MHPFCAAEAAPPNTQGHTRAPHNTRCMVVFLVSVVNGWVLHVERGFEKAQYVLRPVSHPTRAPLRWLFQAGILPHECMVELAQTQSPVT
jgi:hypothetical protein